MFIRFFGDDVPLVGATDKIYCDRDLFMDTFDRKLAHMSFLREPVLTYIPRELLLLLEKHYSDESQFGRNNHDLLLTHIANILYEVKTNFFL